MANINWSQYNKKLIKRGEILLDFTTLKNWKKNSKNEQKQKRKTIQIPKRTHQNTLPPTIQRNTRIHQSTHCFVA
jgi:hypothetical protein